MTEETSNPNSQQRGKRFNLSTLFFIMTICVILMAWLVDHRRLASQVEPPKRKHVKVYRLSHSDSADVAKFLSIVFENDDYTLTDHSPDNSLFIATDEETHKSIQQMLKFLDRKGTNFRNGILFAPPSK